MIRLEKKNSIKFYENKFRRNDFKWKISFIKIYGLGVQTNELGALGFTPWKPTVFTPSEPTRLAP